MRIQLTTALLALAGLSVSTSAQIEYGGAPLPAAAVLEVNVPTLALPGVNRAELLAEDEAAPKGAFRFGVTLPTDVSMDDAGVWQTLPNGTRVWRLRFESPGARSLSFLFSRWQLSEGAELFLYNDERETVRGAYTWLNNKPNGQMAILPTPGQAITIEYIEPAGVSAPGEIEISGVVHDYRDFYALDAEVQPSRGGSCNVDVNCSQGNNWRTQIDATVQTILGGFVCSAMMINNTANDGRQLVMSANHCGSMSNAVFRFNYQRSGCNSGGSPTNQTVQGSSQLATSTSSDFRLAVINPTIPVSYGATFGGWNRGSGAASNTVGIHHPSGCPKKISFDNHPPTRLGSFWRVNDWDLGTTEGGSSGSPLFDQNGRFIGQLYGGFAACGNNSWDEYGALNAYWNSVRTHLDPLNTGVVTLDAYDPGALPMALNSVSPSTIENLIVGSAETITLSGTGFQASSSILIDGVAAAGTFSYVSPTTMKLQWEPVNALGAHTVTVMNTDGQSSSKTVTVVGNAAPTLQIGNGEPLNTFAGFSDLVVGGQPGDISYVVASTSGFPSVLAGKINLQLGNNFTSIFPIGTYVVGANGTVTDSLFSGGINFVVLYWQGLDIKLPIAANYPLASTNLQTTFTP